MLRVRYPEVWVPEFTHFEDVLMFGARKYGNMNWLQENGTKSSFKQMHDSMFHHVAESFTGQRHDKDTNLDPLLHLTCRALMMYTRIHRGLIHESEK